MSRRYTPKRAVVLTEQITESSSPQEREGQARRRIVATTGRCPCGARLVVPDLAPGTVAVVAVEHEPGCPAIDGGP